MMLCPQLAVAANAAILHSVLLVLLVPYSAGVKEFMLSMLQSGHPTRADPFQQLPVYFYSW
jgi:hypothetical protein